MKIVRNASALTVAAAVALTGCASSSKRGDSTTPAAASPGASSTAPALTGTINVFAASSLTGTFTDLGKKFQAAHPGVKVVFSFGASSTLATQIVQGAPADVFASAATKNMQTVVDANDAGTPTNFVKNSMEIAVPPTNPGRVTALADLAKSSVKVALCQAAVPCGVTAHTVLTNAHLTVKPVTEEADVKATLSKVTLLAVDAAIVYVTDVKAAGATLKGIEIPANVNADTEYPIATLSHAANPTAAAAFVAYVKSSVGQSVLTAAGFSAP